MIGTRKKGKKGSSPKENAFRAGRCLIVGEWVIEFAKTVKQVPPTRTPLIPLQ